MRFTFTISRQCAQRLWQAAQAAAQCMPDVRPLGSNCHRHAMALPGCATHILNRLQEA